MFLLALSILTVAVNCQSLPRLELRGYPLSNNSYVCYSEFGEGGSALDCVTDNVTCCNDSDVGGWSYARGRPVLNETSWYGWLYMYATRGDRVISINRVRGHSYGSTLLIHAIFLIPVESFRVYSFI